eukprot:990649-Alexandrium_andersonii.AAC.1
MPTLKQVRWSPEFKIQKFAKVDSTVQVNSEHATLLQASEPGTARAQERPQSCSQSSRGVRSA